MRHTMRMPVRIVLHNFHVFGEKSFLQDLATFFSDPRNALISMNAQTIFGNINTRMTAK